MRTQSPVFVGRHEERCIIDQAFDDARERHGLGIFMEGLAGSGKSRLVEYALDEAARRGFLTLFGIAGEDHEGAPYGLLLDAFRRHARRGGSCEHGLSPNAPLEITPWLDARSAWAQLVGFRPAEGLQGPQHAFHEISRGLAQHGGPVLLALEDVHYADRASLEIVESLQRELPASPVLLLVTYRTEELMRDSARAARIHRMLRRPRAHHVPIGGLSLAETRELVVAMMPPGGEHGFLTRQLHRRTEGIPLFLEELLHGIVRDGAGPDAALPVSFRAAVRSRLGGLAREDMRLLQLASVIGEWFDLATLAFLGRRSENAVLQALGRFRDQQLLRESTDRREFKFWHALTRDALYEQLLLPDRKALHRRVAQHWMSAPAKAEAPPASAIAYHLEKAGEEADAARYYAVAAERAAALCAFDEAFAHGERAFAFASDDRGTKALQASHYARLAGHVDTALAYCRKAKELFDDSQPRRRAELLLHESDLYWLQGNGRRAAGVLREVTEIRTRDRDTTDAPVWAWLLARTAHRACMESRWGDVFDPADQAIAMSRRLSQPSVEAHALITRSLAEAAVNGLERGRSTLQRGRALAEKHGAVEDVCRSYVIEVDLRSREGDFAAACRIAAEGAERAHRAGAPVILYPTLAVSALEFSWKSGAWQEALDRVPETERLVNEQPSDLVRCHFRSVLASIATARHRLVEAERALADAIHLARAIHEAQWALPVVAAATEFALLARKPAQALRHAIDALERFPNRDLAEATAVAALGLEAICVLRATGGEVNVVELAALKLKRSRAGGRTGEFHARLADGFTALLAEKFSPASGAFRQAADLAVTMGFPLGEARARAWLATTLRQLGPAEAKQDSVRERNRARAILATIPGRPDDGGSALEILSEREREVARLVSDGLPNKEIGGRLSISERTVAVHISRIFAKVGVDSRHRLTALIAKTGG
ncbi:MAG: LuxR C-terminal-related transcriptional regulator [Opitutaceae bacterium]|nr:LuxR C-terminal-related transcriptional regulator [Opitutaceae bacterium]